MRGTPNEFFSFLPDHERTAAIQAFAIIRRCDETLRFEALVGSWLVSRLITILRIDNTALKTIISTKEPPAPAGSFELSKPPHPPMNYNVDADAPNFTPAPVDASYSQKAANSTEVDTIKSNNPGSIIPPGVDVPPIPSGVTNSAEKNGVTAPTAPPAPDPFADKEEPQKSQTKKTGPRKLELKPGVKRQSRRTVKFYEISEEFDPDNPVPGEENFLLKSKVPPKPITTRRIIVSSDKPLFMYVGHLQSSGAAMNGFATHLAGIISSFSTAKGTSTTVASAISYCLNLLEHSEHRSKLLNGLCSIIIHCHPSMREINEDNEKALDDDSDGIIIPDKARMDLKRILTTALCCILLQVKTSCEAVQDFDYIWEACCDKGGDMSSAFQDNDQTSKECAWLLSIGSYLSQDLSSRNLTHADRRKIRLLFSGASILMLGQSTMLLTQQKSHGSIFAEESPKKRRRLDHDDRIAYARYRAEQKKKEMDVIAKICQIGKKDGPVEGLAEIGESDNSRTHENICTEPKKQSMIETVMQAINELSSNTIQPSIVGDEFSKVAQVAKNIKLFHYDDDQRYLRDLISSTPLQSKFSTYHERVSSVETLRQFCTTLLSTTQNSYSPNGPSIFTGFSFVDETLLVADSTTYVRLYLIDYNEREEAISVEHVAANVRFYKSISGPDEGNDTSDTEPIERLQTQPFMKKGDMIDTLDLNTWTEMLLEASSQRIKPSTKLLFYIGSCNKNRVFSANQDTVGQVMIPVLNQALERLSKTEKCDRQDYLSVDATGKMRANYRCDSARISLQAKVIGRAMVCLYYDALESILDFETARLKSTCHINLLLNLNFHKALLSICLICVVHATSGNSSNSQEDKNGYGSQLFVQSILKLMDCTSYEYMKVSESFTISLESSSKSLNKTVHKLPKLLLKKLLDTEVRLLEFLLWSRCPSTDRVRTTIGIIETLKSNINKNPSLWPPQILTPIQDEEILNEINGSEDSDVSVEESTTIDLASDESSFIDYLITKLLSLVSNRIAMLCGQLQMPPHYTRQVWYMFRQILRKKIHLLYGRNVDQLILCTIYGICKVVRYQPELSFTKIIEVYKRCFDSRLDKNDLQKMIRNVTMNSDGQKGTVIEFYNQIYLPTMKTYLRKSKSMFKDKQVDQLESPHRHPGMMKLHDSNLHLNVSSATTPILKKECPRTRALYGFGDASSAKSMRLIKKTINC